MSKAQYVQTTTTNNSRGKEKKKCHCFFHANKVFTYIISPREFLGEVIHTLEFRKQAALERKARKRGIKIWQIIVLDEK